ncbi:Peroxidasin homolog [Seminavis robusta]|uniref:Peroxidasin homolog n=1 Tax=Seminavis robusta TaxID=568900 RepID=A0A9N8EMZ7_9STRA|nr:Peroxidasin homolog [Seminavis robusta]|eukprot:Sro1252_g256250.1 Peroxidasin homolog (542) ;mRNA; r:10043-12451
MKLSSIFSVLLVATSVAMVVAQGNGNGGGNGVGNTMKLEHIRTIEGYDRDDDLGAAHTPLRRLSSVNYQDDIGEMIEGRNPRNISNAVCRDPSGSGNTFNARGMSDMVWAWGQFIDHDIDLTEPASSFGSIAVEIPATDGDVFSEAGCAEMVVTRSEFVESPRQQVNLITSCLDASGVYGSEPHRADLLRTKVDGKLKTSAGGLLLPYNEYEEDNAGGTGNNLFLAGDIRANEQIGLTAMHTLFVREHNRLADKIKQHFKDASDEEIYQLARKLVGAEIQKITYTEFLPALLGDMAPSLDDYDGYDPSYDPSIFNEFSTVAYRFGHSMISGDLALATQSGITQTVRLKDHFFLPSFYEEDASRIDMVIAGLTKNVAQEIDNKIVEDVRSFLFDAPTDSVCLDLAGLNIMRARDHGLPKYNEMREALGLGRVDSFSQVTSDTTLQEELASVYESVDEIDPWVGALAEDHVGGGNLGQLASFIISKQFEHLMRGDPLFYLIDPDLAAIQNLNGILNLKTLNFAEVIRQNTFLSNINADNVFFV